MKHIAFILGTRPEILKLTSVIKEIPPEQREIIWTGQHYTPSLAEDWWEEEGFNPTAICEFKSRYATDCEAERLAAMIPALVCELQRKAFDWVVVQGDTTSAFAGAYAALKLSIPILHVESGGRSGQRDQAEEQNRRLIDTIATCRAAAYLHDMNNLMREGLSEGSFWSGDTLIDGLKEWEEKNPQDELRYGGRPIATIHRSETLNNPDYLHPILDFMSALGGAVVFAHPHLQKVIGEEEIREHQHWNIIWRSPLRPSEFRDILRGACRDNEDHFFITDSGGAATEAAYMGVPTLIARDVLELSDLEKCGRLVLGGRTAESLSAAMLKLQCNAPLSLEVKQAWHGQAGKLIAERLMA